MAQWLQKLNIDKEREMAENGNIESAMDSVIAKFKTLKYQHKEDKDFHSSTCDDLDMLDKETEDDFNDMLYTLYEFGDTISGGDLGYGFSHTQKLLWIEP